MSGAHASQKQPQHVSLRLLVIVTTIVFLVVAAAAGFFAMQFFALKSSPEVTDDETSRLIINKVEGIYMLPEGQPTVAKVQDTEKLNGQAFFEKAENGDYLVIYSEAKLALLYREGANKLVNVGPISVSDTAAQEAASDPAAKIDGN
jgi:hypothetical protein